MADSYLFDLATGVIAALEAGYPAAPDVAALPERRYVSDGVPAWDCEQLTVHVVRTFNAALPGGGAAGAPGIPAFGKGPTIRAAEIVVTIVRCSPTIGDDDGLNEASIPSVEEIEAAALVVLSDAEMIPMLLEEAVRTRQLPSCEAITFVSWDGAGPEGGLVGGGCRLQLLLT
jgi:hypothetical protein